MQYSKILHEFLFHKSNFGNNLDDIETNYIYHILSKIIKRKKNKTNESIRRFFSRSKALLIRQEQPSNGKNILDMVAPRFL